MNPKDAVWIVLLTANMAVSSAGARDMTARYGRPTARRHRVKAHHHWAHEAADE
jgi:hypothetical protein